MGRVEIYHKEHKGHKEKLGIFVDFVIFVLKKTER